MWRFGSGLIAMLLAVATQPSTLAVEAPDTCLSGDYSSLLSASAFQWPYESPITLDINTWSSQKLTTYLLYYCLRDVLGMDVRLVESPGFFDAEGVSVYERAEEGELDVNVEIWQNNREEWYDQHVASGAAEDLGLVGYSGRPGWFYPKTNFTSSLVALPLWSSLKSESAVEIFGGDDEDGLSPSLNGVSRGDYLADAGSEGCGDAPDFLEDCSYVPDACSSGETTCVDLICAFPAWKQGYHEQLINNLELPVRTRYMTSAYENVISDFINNDQTFLFYHWTPSTLFFEYDVDFERIMHPLSTVTCQAGDTKQPDGQVDCDFEEEKFIKVGSPRVASTAGLRSLVSKFAISDSDLSTMMESVVQDGKIESDAACDWLKENEEKMEKWFESTQCEPGWVPTLSGECEPCPPGTYHASGLGKCAPCGYAKYNPSVGQTSCVHCGEHKSTCSVALINGVYEEYCNPEATEPSQCQCTSGSYEDSTGDCIRCPVGGHCCACPQNYACVRIYQTSDTGLSVSETVASNGTCDPFSCTTCTQGSLPVARSGYHKEAGSDVWPVKCPNPDACLGNDVCKDGYEGYLCAQCSQGDERYYHYGNTCRKCPSHSKWLIVPQIVGVILAVNWLLRASAKYFRSGAMSLLVEFIQIVLIFRQLPVEWPNACESAFGIVSFVSLDLDLLAVDCNVDSNSSGLDVSSLFMPVAILFIGCVISLGWYIYYIVTKPLNWEVTFKKKTDYLIGSYIAFLSLAHAYLTQKSLAIFNCRSNPGGSQHWSVNPEIECFSKEWNQIAVLSICIFVIYGLGIPLLFWWIIQHHSRELDLPMVKRRYSLLYTIYMPHRRFFEVWVKLKKVQVIILLQVFVNAVAYQYVFASVVLVLSLYMSSLEPYRYPRNNALGLLSSFCSLVLLLLGVVFMTTDQAATESDVGEVIFLFIFFSVVAILLHGTLYELFAFHMVKIQQKWPKCARLLLSKPIDIIFHTKRHISHKAISHWAIQERIHNQFQELRDEAGEASPVAQKRNTVVLEKESTLWNIMKKVVSNDHDSQHLKKFMEERRIMKGSEDIYVKDAERLAFEVPQDALVEMFFRPSLHHSVRVWKRRFTAERGEEYVSDMFEKLRDIGNGIHEMDISSALVKAHVTQDLYLNDQSSSEDETESESESEEITVVYGDRPAKTLTSKKSRTSSKSKSGVLSGIGDLTLPMPLYDSPAGSSRVTPEPTVMPSQPAVAFAGENGSGNGHSAGDAHLDKQRSTLVRRERGAENATLDELLSLDVDDET